MVHLPDSSTMQQFPHRQAPAIFSRHAVNNPYQSIPYLAQRASTSNIPSSGAYNILQDSTSGHIDAPRRQGQSPSETWFPENHFPYHGIKPADNKFIRAQKKLDRANRNASDKRSTRHTPKKVTFDDQVSEDTPARYERNEQRRMLRHQDEAQLQAELQERWLCLNVEHNSYPRWPHRYSNHPVVLARLPPSRLIPIRQRQNSAPTSSPLALNARSHNATFLANGRPPNESQALSPSPVFPINKPSDEELDEDPLELEPGCIEGGLTFFPIRKLFCVLPYQNRVHGLMKNADKFNPSYSINDQQINGSKVRQPDPFPQAPEPISFQRRIPNQELDHRLEVEDEREGGSRAYGFIRTNRRDEADRSRDWDPDWDNLVDLTGGGETIKTSEDV